MMDTYNRQASEYIFRENNAVVSLSLSEFLYIYIYSLLVLCSQLRGPRVCFFLEGKGGLDADAEFVWCGRGEWMGIRLICMGSLWRRRRGFWRRGYGMRGGRGRRICMCELIGFFCDGF